MLIGIDDTDSERQGCTTYLATILVEKLKIKKYPKLIRLNPNIPYKTRGNGAVALTVKTLEPEKVKELVLREVKKRAQLQEEETNPGIVFLEKRDKKKKKILEKFYQKAVSQLVEIKKAEKVAQEVKAEVYKFKLGRGLIGALAALGATLPDKTYELLAYRIKKNYGKEKKLDKASVFEMDKKTFPKTWDNLDKEKGKILICPHGYDPVFCGIRGETPEIVKKAWEMIKTKEEIAKWQIFETNQGTDAHLREKKISQINPYDCLILKGKVSKNPKTIEGGHVIFEFSDSTGRISAAAYKKTGNFQEVIRKLKKGDKVKVYGGLAKYSKTLNLEKIEILSLEKIYQKEIPFCCGKKMTSAGKGKGYKCKKCGKRIREIKEKEVQRGLKEGFYEVSPEARRHLSRPLIRMKNYQPSLL